MEKEERTFNREVKKETERREEEKLRKIRKTEETIRRRKNS